MMNLLNLGLDKRTYFTIYELLFRHNKTDIEEFEQDLILVLLNMNIQAKLDEMQTLINTMDEITYHTKIEMEDVSSRLETINNKINTKSIDEKIQKHLTELEFTHADHLTNIENQFLESISIVKELIDPLNEIIDFLDTKKALNLRKPIDCPKKAILLLRQKLKHIAG